MTLSIGWIEQIEDLLNNKISSVNTVSGGDINEAVSFECGGKSYFFKYNSSEKARDLLNLEFRGLTLLKSSKTIETVEPLQLVESSDGAGLLLPFIKSGNRQQQFWESFGVNLAMLHSSTSSFFGLDEDNYIGSIRQVNTKTDSWPDFYANYRILPLVESSFNEGLLNRKLLRASELFCKRLPELFPQESSSLLHGDLWSGNYMCDISQVPILIDPAVYYGHREMDIAMTTLFGSCDPTFYRNYNNTSPLEKGWEGRLKYGHLYYLMVHLVLFGSSYLQSVTNIFDEFCEQ